MGSGSGSSSAAVRGGGGGATSTVRNPTTLFPLFDRGRETEATGDGQPRHRSGGPQMDGPREATVRPTPRGPPRAGIKCNPVRRRGSDFGPEAWDPRARDVVGLRGDPPLAVRGGDGNYGLMMMR